MVRFGAKKVGESLPFFIFDGIVTFIPIRNCTLFQIEFLIRRIKILILHCLPFI